MRGEPRWTGAVIRAEWLMKGIAAAQSVRDLELLAAEARSALAGHPDLARFEVTISAKQRLLARAQALLDEIALIEAGEEDRW